MPRYIDKIELNTHDNKTYSIKAPYDTTLPHHGIIDEVLEARSTYDDLNARLDDITAGAGGTFLTLSDTPSSYSGQSGNVVTVKATEDGLEFAAGGGTPKLNDILNPDGDKTFAMTTHQIGFLWTTPTGNPMELEASGAYTGALLHIHQHTGNPGSAYLLELEASDTDVEHVKSTGAATTTEFLGLYVSGDTEERFALYSDGKMEWGAGGAAALDTNLYRSAANILATDDAFNVGGTLSVISGTSPIIKFTETSISNYRLGVDADKIFIDYDEGADGGGDFSPYTRLQIDGAADYLQIYPAVSGELGLGTGTYRLAEVFTNEVDVDGPIYFGESTNPMKKFGGAYSASIAATTEIEIGRFTYTGNSQNVTIYGEITGVASQTWGVSRFILGCRSSTLPTVVFALSQQQIYGGKWITAKAYYKDNGDNTVTVVLCYYSNAALHNVGWSIEIVERGNYEYWENKDSYSVFTTTGFTEITEYTASDFKILSDMNINDNIDLDAGTGLITALGGIQPESAGGGNIGSTSREFGHAYFGDDKYVYFGLSQDAYIGWINASSYLRIQG
jgi:hypothetical protein